MEDTATRHQRFSALIKRFDLGGRGALIVGGTKGIGAAIAAALADAGADVVVVGRNEERLQETVNALRHYGTRIEGIVADLADSAQRSTLIGDAVERLGRIDILVNVAGTKPLRGEMIDRPDVFERVLQTNVNATYEVSLAAARVMRTHKWGRIITVSSVTGLKARSGMGEYAITKAAQIMMARSMAQEFGQYGVTVNCLVPVLTRTEFSAAQLADPSDVERVLSMQAIRRVAEPDDVCGAALLLASNAGAFITGTSIVVDGGALA